MPAGRRSPPLVPRPPPQPCWLLPGHTAQLGLGALVPARPGGGESPAQGAGTRVQRPEHGAPARPGYSLPEALPAAAASETTPSRPRELCRPRRGSRRPALYSPKRSRCGIAEAPPTN